MKRIRIIGLALFAAFALSAVAVSSASALEFGKCVKKTGGAYKNSGCSLKEAGNEKFAWEPYSTLSAASKKFSAKLKEGIATLETESGTKVTCTGEKNTGAEVSGPQEVSKVVAEFSGCESNGVKCNGTGQGVGLITTASLSGTMGIEKPGATKDKDKIAQELHGPGGGALANFECSALAKIAVTGNILHKATVNKMLLTATEKFAATKAEQKPDHYAGGKADDHILFSALNGGTPEEAGQTITALVTFEEKIELSTVN